MSFAADPRYSCALYRLLAKKDVFLLVCEKYSFPIYYCRRADWELLTLGYNPPDRVKPVLKSQKFCELNLGYI